MNIHSADWQKKDPEKWPEQKLKGHLIPGDRYSSKEFFAQEWEEMWTKVWLLLGRADEIPEPGDYQMEEVGPESIIMVRQKDMSIKAFYNVCQHRAARLVFNDVDSVEAFVCPYHGWRFEIDGELTEARDAEDFPEGNPCGKLKLVEIPCDTFVGFIWVNMDPDCVSLKEYLGPIWDEWSKYEIQDWKRYLAMTANVPCNWKIVLDNFNESYHLPTVHPEAAAVVEESYKYTQFDMSAEGHNRMWQQAFKPSLSQLKNGDELMGPALAMRMEGWGLNPDDFAGREFESREAVQAQMRVMGPDMGYTHFDNLTDHQLTDVYHYTIFPNFAVSVWADSFHFLRARPHPTDPTKCVFDNWYYAPAPEGMDTPVLTINGPVERDAEIEHDVFEYGEKSLSPLIDQDMGVTLGQQLGLRSRAFSGVYLSHQEHRIRRYHEVIDEYINGTRPGPNQNSK